MLYLFLSLVSLGIIAAILTLFSKKKEGEPDVVQSSSTSCSTCSGEDPRCEQECMMEASTKDIEYYDDEELDEFKGRPAESYTDEEVEIFSEVLYTLKPGEAKGWNRSLILRGINIPNQLKDELVMMIEG